MRILHFSDVHIGVENYGRVDPESGLSTRLLDFLSTLDELVEFALGNDVDLVLLALGFLHPQKEGMIKQLEVELDPRGNVETDVAKLTSVPGVFAAGDMSRGQSLVVWAIAEGRQAAHGIDKYLMGASDLPSVSLRGWV